MYNYGGILSRQPSEKGWNSHDEPRERTRGIGSYWSAPHGCTLTPVAAMADAFGDTGGREGSSVESRKYQINQKDPSTRTTIEQVGMVGP